MLHRIEILVRRIRRWFSRSEWLIRCFGLSRSQDTASEPGLIMLQIDGLSRRQMERALAAGQLPFLRHLLDKQQYRMIPHYSGMPASTPAVQGELFYGVKTAVPAFSFYDRDQQQTMRMYEPHAARSVERQLENQGDPLLAGGSSYCNVYSGGAQDAHFCASTMGLAHAYRQVTSFGPLLLLLFNPYSLVRTGVLMAVEFMLALLDAARGLIAGHDLWKELKFVPARVGICVLLRELATIGAKIDAARGLPIIHANFPGYDEQAHRRGPSSRFAHWALRGIDDAIKRIARAGRRSARRDYDVWVYSDHGQEGTLAYPRKHGKTLQQAVSEVFADGPIQEASSIDAAGVQSRRIRLLRERGRHRDERHRGESHERQEPDRPIIAAMGPVAHVYPQRELTAAEHDALAGRLIEEAGIPMVLDEDENGRCRARIQAGTFLLPEEGDKLLGADHPFADEVAHDLLDLVRHRHAGTFVLCGWSRDQHPVSFPVENGSHAGPGPEETSGFALLPMDAPLVASDKAHLRPTDLRQSALDTLGQAARVPKHRAVLRKARLGSLRVMTYNVHSCVGLDGKLSPRRIARVIAQHDPDVVALQELDAGRARTQGHDQARLIAERLWMEHHFHPALRLQEEQYGDAIMSRWPMKLVRVGSLPRPPQAAHLEPRGALWVTLDLHGHAVHVLNTHLGLKRQERFGQIRALLGDDWLGRIDSTEPVVVCGDFNCFPGSAVYNALAARFRDVQTSMNGHRPLNTWFGRYPVSRIDHVFVSDHFGITRVEVGDSDLARVSSDHRPLLAELEVRDA